MYAGSIAEQAEAIEIFEYPKHPYTQGCGAPSRSSTRKRKAWRSFPERCGFGPAPQGCKFTALPHRFEPWTASVRRWWRFHPGTMPPATLRREA